MKVLIWIGCFFCMAVTQVIIKDNGIILGGIPTALLFGLTLFIAQKLCKRWDRRNEQKSEDTAPQKVAKKTITALLSKRKLFLLITVICVILMVTSVILFDYNGVHFFEHCANVFLILTIIFGSISLTNILITIIIPFIRKGR